MGKDAAGEKVAELLFHEVRQAGTVGAMRCLAEKGLEVLADDRVEDTPLRCMRLVGSAVPAW